MTGTDSGLAAASTPSTISTDWFHVTEIVLDWVSPRMIESYGPSRRAAANRKYSHFTYKYRIVNEMANFTPELSILQYILCTTAILSNPTHDPSSADAFPYGSPAYFTPDIQLRGGQEGRFQERKNVAQGVSPSRGAIIRLRSPAGIH